MGWHLDPDDADCADATTWYAPAGLTTRRNVRFRVRMQIRSTATRLRIAVAGTYRLWVAGAEIGCGPARGGRTEAPIDCWVPDQALPTGTWIALDVWCGNYASFRQPGWSPAVLVDGVQGSWFTQVAEDWREDAPHWNAQQGHSAWYDLRHEPTADWTLGAPAGQWHAAVPVAAPAPASRRGIAALEERRCQPLHVSALALVPAVSALAPADPGRLCAEEWHQPVPDGWCVGSLEHGDLEITTDARGVALIATLPYLCTAGVEIELETESGGTLDLAYGEHLVDGRIRSHLRRGGMSDYSFAHRAELRPGRQVVHLPPLSKGVLLVQLVFQSF
jgi:hypothetical protein